MAAQSEPEIQPSRKTARHFAALHARIENAGVLLPSISLILAVTCEGRMPELSLGSG